MAGYNKKDRFHQKAKDEQFAARSVYKLEELDRRFGVVRKGDKVVDLGCAPGSWLQYLSRAVGKSGAIVGYDIEPLALNPGLNVRAFVASIDDLTPQRVRADLAALVSERKGKPPPDPVPPSFGVDALISDMAPKLTGIRDADQAKQAALVGAALDLAESLLKAGGRFTAKMFQGRETDPVLDRCKQRFSRVRLIKPEATRDGSREVFVVAWDPKPPLGGA